MFVSYRDPARMAGLLVALVFGLLLAPAFAQPGESPVPSPESRISFDIPAQSLDEALIEFGQQSRQELFYEDDDVAGLTGNPVVGEMTRTEAMRALLAGTGLEFERTASGGMMVGTRTTLDAQRPTSSVAGQNEIGQRQPGIEEIIVTGQKREERIQDVPIAISAFSPEDLEAQKIEGGFDLLKGVPNVTFTKTNFTGYNFSIRGIGTQAISATTDPGVAVSFNNTTLIVNRLFEQEYLDVERVEVLRGPQGTLFGRNATAGVINVISNKPELGVWDGMIDVEVGNHNTRRLRGFFNAPIGEEIAIRGAYASTKRDGFGINQAAEDFDVQRDVDNRDLWTARLSLGWQPTDRFRANLIWERFEEDDRRVRTAKQLCHRDEGPDKIGNVPVENLEPVFQKRVRENLQQGCVGGSLYSDGAFDTPNGAAFPFILAAKQNDGQVISFHSGSIVGGTGTGQGRDELSLINDDVDVFANRRQSRDLRTIYSKIEPSYRAEADIFEFSFDYEISDSLVFSSQTVYVEDEVFSTQDFNRFEPTAQIFNEISPDSDQLYESFFGGLRRVADNLNEPWLSGANSEFRPVVTPDRDGEQNFNTDPDGIFCDPQLGCSSELIIQDISQQKSTQFNQEFRLVSSFAGDWNFSLGLNYTRFETQADYFVFSNILTALALTPPFRGPSHPCGGIGSNERSGGEPIPGADVDRNCVSIQQDGLLEVPEDPQGHNFFLSANPYELNSEAVFGELYWQATDTVKVTAGLRFTWDQKVFSPIPSQTLLSDFRTGEIAGGLIQEGDGPEACTVLFALCGIYGSAPGGAGYPANPDIVQRWREPTGRFVVDWSPLLDFTDETLVYASFSHGYKGGGANPPTIAPPAGLFIQEAQGAVASPTFEPEFINAYELGTKNTLFGGALVLNGTAFYYDYTDYQVSKIVDRSAANENLDAEVRGAELELIFSPSLAWQFNAAIGWLDTEIASGEQSIDLMDRTQGGDRFFITELPNRRFDPSLEPRPRSEYVAAVGTDPSVDRNFAWEDEEGNFQPIPADQEFLAFDDWVVVKPNLSQSSNCIAPTGLFTRADGSNLAGFPGPRLCPGGNITGNQSATGAPNGGAGFFDDVGGNKLPNAPEFTVALGGQYNFDLTRDWRATARVDYYWQDESFARIYNTEIDRLKSWSNTNLSFWVTNPNNGITVEGYVKNVFDETPITGTFLNSDDTGLTTNVFTLEPRLIGVSVRKEF